MMRSKVECIKNNFELLYHREVGVFVKNLYELKVTNPCNIQSEFTALQGAPYCT